MQNIPNKQVAAYRETLAQVNEYKSDAELRKMIYLIILGNPICSNCLRKDLKLYMCADCGIEWYCGEACEEKHWSIHGKYCCNVTGDWPANSPFRPALIKRS